jgi:hypothetical protein
MNARRYNKGKARYELVPNKPFKYLVDVYTKGAHKYSIYEDENGNEILGSQIPIEDVSNYKLIDDAASNWTKGLPWKETMAAIKRHIAKWDEGEDIDVELNTFHLANASWGLFSLMEYMTTHPELDDRNHKYLNHPRIGFDIDDVCADFTGAWSELHNIPRPTAWSFDRTIVDKFNTMKYNGKLEEFYLDLPVLTNPKDIPYEPTCYVTSRPVSSEISEQWLDKNGFPAAPVYTVGIHGSKVDILKEKKVDIFVDDRFDNFVELNKAGICTFLFDRIHNHRYSVGYKRIYSLKELVERY